jgi:hypothetical protein
MGFVLVQRLHLSDTPFSKSTLKQPATSGIDGELRKQWQPILPWPVKWILRSKPDIACFKDWDPILARNRH